MLETAIIALWKPMAPIVWFGLGAGCCWVGTRCYPPVRQWFVKVAGTALLGLLLSTAVDAQHVHKDGSTYTEDLGRFYANWRQPINRTADGERVISCCSDMDCEPAEIVMKGGKYYVRNHKMARGRDVLVPDHLIEQNQRDMKESPDGRNHACLNHSGVLCVTLGAGG
jgi:hypothetical protein